jgi:hypothetical protein
LAIVKKHIAAKLKIKQNLHPEWRMPTINFHCRKDSIDWNIYSIARSLLPENRSDTQLLYNWAKEIN